uniref:Uncharacterized protein n=1 Tax=Tanacetum cinerariifolium TaxID=118510 RepID=A0A699HUV2_TANCI|nr:hypothetical protein [Tanacetum cinerariifolium]
MVVVEMDMDHYPLDFEGVAGQKGKEKREKRIFARGKEYNGQWKFLCLTFKFKSKEAEESEVNSGYVVENVLMGCGGAYIRNEGNKKYNKYKEGEEVRKLKA